MAKKDEKDMTPTKLTHVVSGVTVRVPAHKAEERVKSGLFAKPTASKSSRSE